jgi:hypothetical protein
MPGHRVSADRHRASWRRGLTPDWQCAVEQTTWVIASLFEVQGRIELVPEELWASLHALGMEQHVRACWQEEVHLHWNYTRVRL